MTTSLINWPDNNPEYEGTGENGLLAYAVWPYYSMKTETAVTSETTLRFYELFVSAEGPQASQIESFIDDLRKKVIKSSVPEEEWRMQFGAVLLLGTTSTSYAMETDLSNSGYFNVTEDSLTEEGQELLNTLSALYECEPTLITFLDT